MYIVLDYPSQNSILILKIGMRFGVEETVQEECIVYVEITERTRFCHLTRGYYFLHCVLD